jgi:glucose/arabinose dehydrogenase
MRRVGVILISVLLALSVSGLASARITQQVVKNGLNYPASFVFDRNGRIFYAELKGGRIHILNPATKEDSVFFTIPNLEAAGGEQGLLGIALHPNYPSTPYVYAYATRTVNGVTRQHFLRIRDNGGVGGNMTSILDIPSGAHHNGGKIGFGPDGMLYAVVGDNNDPANAQNPNTLVGKVLRMTPSGGIPTSNPNPASRIIGSGIRNSFGFAFDPQTGRMWEAENGPQCNDEMNLIARFSVQNYGWGPSWTCLTPPPAPLNTNQDGPSPNLPEFFWPDPPAPTGTAFCSGCRLGTASRGKMFVGQYNDGRLRRFALNSTRTAIVGNSVVYTAPSNILALERAPNGRLYFSTSGAIYRLVLS